MEFFFSQNIIEILYFSNKLQKINNRIYLNYKNSSNNNTYSIKYLYSRNLDLQKQHQMKNYLNEIIKLLLC